MKLGIFCPPRPAPITAVADEQPGPAEMLPNRTRGNLFTTGADMSNPYTVKRTPTRARTEAEKAASIARSRATPPAPKPAPVAPKPGRVAGFAAGVMGRAQGGHKAVTAARIERGVDPKPKKRPTR